MCPWSAVILISLSQGQGHIRSLPSPRCLQILDVLWLTLPMPCLHSQTALLVLHFVTPAARPPRMIDCGAVARLWGCVCVPAAVLEAGPPESCCPASWAWAPSVALPPSPPDRISLSRDQAFHTVCRTFVLCQMAKSGWSAMIPSACEGHCAWVFSFQK